MSYQSNNTSVSDIRIVNSRMILPLKERVLQVAGYGKNSIGYDKGETYYSQLLPSFRVTVQAKGAFTLDLVNNQLYAVLTLGSSIDKWIDRQFEKGDFFAGYIANAMSDAGLYQWEEQVLQYIEEACRQANVGIIKRYEPGMNVPLGIQSKLATALATQRTLNVTLDEKCIWHPLKTMSILFDIRKGSTEMNSKHDCSQCSREHCFMKAEPTKATVRINCPAGEAVQHYLQAQQVFLPHDCGGMGKCGKCKIRVLQGDIPITTADKQVFTETELQAGWRMACQSVTKTSTLLEVPKQENIYLALGQSATKNTDISSVADLGIAIDIGTTTLALSLVDISKQQVIDTITGENGQRIWGADVVSRIQASLQGKDKELQHIIQQNIVELIRRLMHIQGNLYSHIHHIVISANTVMYHLLRGFSCKGLGSWPFAPVSYGGETIPCQQILPQILELSGCDVTFLPHLSAYVGSDITAGIYLCDMTKYKDISLLVDLGTNGEIALGNCDQLLVASAPAGPAFEGGSIQYGCGSIPGAISQVEFRYGSFFVRTIGNLPPKGICGTGLVAALTALRRADYVDTYGTLVEPWQEQGVPLVQQETGEFIYVTQRDIRALQMAKGAIRAGMEIVLKKYGITWQEIKHFYVAGGFGYYLQPAMAIDIGLLPSDLVVPIQTVGNTSLRGATAVLYDPSCIEEMKILRQKTKECILSNDASFQDIYINALNFSGGMVVKEEVYEKR